MNHLEINSNTMCLSSYFSDLLAEKGLRPPQVTIVIDRQYHGHKMVVDSTSKESSRCDGCTTNHDYSAKIPGPMHLSVPPVSSYYSDLFAEKCVVSHVVGKSYDQKPGSDDRGVNDLQLVSNPDLSIPQIPEANMKKYTIEAIESFRSKRTSSLSPTGRLKKRITPPSPSSLSPVKRRIMR